MLSALQNSLSRYREFTGEPCHQKTSVLSAQPMQYEFATEPSGEEYGQLLEFCSLIAEQALLVVREGDWLDETAIDILAALQPFTVATTEQSEWPGTTLLGHTATVRRYRAVAPAVAILKDRAHRLYDWRQPARPEDLCFLRTTGDPVLVTIAHEHDSYLRISDEELELLRSRFAQLATLVRSGSRAR